MRRTLASLVLLAACTAPGMDTGGGPITDDSAVGGMIFKGPFMAGGTVTLTPLDDALEPVGDPVVAEILDDMGAYEATIAHEGYVHVFAEGSAYNEADAGQRDDQDLDLVALARLEGGNVSVFPNIVTDLTHLRVKKLVVEDGLGFEEALAQAEFELQDALEIGIQQPADPIGTGLEPYRSGFEPAWLTAVSSVVAQMGKIDEENLGIGLPGIMEDLRVDLADDGLISDEIRNLVDSAEASFDPDLVTLVFGAHVEDFGDSDQVAPDLHVALDTDDDGIANDDDNCRYFPNPDQDADLGFWFGDACDDRVLSISTTDQWGCVVRADTRELDCWEVQGEPTGGTPPRPEIFPSHLRFPWGDGPGLEGTFSEVAVGPDDVCGVRDDGSVECWLGNGVDNLVLEGDYEHIVMSPEMLCLLDRDGLLTCADDDGELFIEGAGPYLDVGLVGDASIVAIDAGTENLVYVAFDGSEEPYSLPNGLFVAVAGDHHGDGYLCAIPKGDKDLRCVGEGKVVDEAPGGTDFVAISVGAHVACAVDAAGAPTCWNDMDACPPVEDPPEVISDVTMDTCQVCGIDEDGLGTCWPRYWTQKRKDGLPPE